MRNLKQIESEIKKTGEKIDFANRFLKALFFAGLSPKLIDIESYFSTTERGPK